MGPEHVDEEPTPHERPAQQPVENPLRHSRTSAAWVGVGALGLVLLLLVIFVAQNTQDVKVSFLGWTGHPPLAVAILVSAVAGLVLAGTAGALRIAQLHRRVRRTR